MPYKNKEDRKKRAHWRYTQNRENSLLRNKKWRDDNIEYLKEYNDKNKQRKSILQKDYYIKTKDSKKLYYQEHKEKIVSYQKEYRKNNQDRIKSNRKNYNERSVLNYRKRMLTDDNYKIRMAISKRIGIAVKRQKTLKHKPTLELLGCSLDELRLHLEKQFKEGMSWDNYGFYGWHIDHIRPCVSFNLIDPQEQAKCFHYTNLQPLWAKDNLSKHDKY